MHDIHLRGMRESYWRWVRLVFGAAAIALLTVRIGAVAQINGAGATFPFPIYSKWFAEYSRLRPDVRINYQSLGSGAGIRQLINGTVFFGASDAPMSVDQLATAPGTILQLPTVIGGVVPIYNLPLSPLTFSGPVLADIYLGRITRWNDPALVRLNPGIDLPATEITVVHRAEGSGTTYIWVDYLSKVSPEFQHTVGVGPAVRWPTGIGGRGNEGVAGVVKQIRGSIGYVELVVATQTGLPYAAVVNASGEAVKATTETMTAAAAGFVARMPANFQMSITNASGRGVYPVASFTWLLLYEAPHDVAQSKVMVDFMKWALTDGQRFAPPLGYAPLPDGLVKLELQALTRIQT